MGVQDMMQAPSPETDVKDCNRGRAYLSDVAIRHDVSVHKVVKDALDVIVQTVPPCPLLDANADVGKVDVFLGGSCNPTTWRADVAVPMLIHKGVTFFNPQVDDWKPELVEIEAAAKARAKILLFVIDAQTRAISSMVEAAELVASGRNVVIVIQYMAPIAISPLKRKAGGMRTAAGLLNLCSHGCL